MNKEIKYMEKIPDKLIRPSWEEVIPKKDEVVFCNGCNIELWTAKEVKKHWKMGHFDISSNTGLCIRGFKKPMGLVFVG